MATPFLRRSGYAFVCLLLSLTLASCDAIFNETDARCGRKNELKVEVIRQPDYPTSPPDFNTQYIFFTEMVTELEGNTRRFTVQSTFRNVCTHEHAKAQFTASARINNQLPLTVKARADWGLLFGTEIPLELRTSTSSWFWVSQEIDIGLEQVYEDGPGLYFVTFEVSFLTLGDEQRDRDWLADSFQFYARLETTYFEHQE